MSTIGQEPQGPPGPIVDGASPAPVGILAIQGSFALHARSLERLGVPWRFVRKPEDLEGLRGLILPGGESTVMSLLLSKYGIFDRLLDAGRRGLPMFGTCAGAILLGRGDGLPPRLGLVPVRLERNAYGTQLDSFQAPLALDGIEGPFHGVFIRAPRIVALVPDRGETSIPKVLGTHAGSPVLVEAGPCLLATFHPELTDDLRIHSRFLEMIRSRAPA